MLLFLISCGPSKEDREKLGLKEIPKELIISSGPVKSPNEYTEYTLDGCQYIVVGTGSGSWGSHKGTCTNIIHSLR